MAKHFKTLITSIALLMLAAGCSTTTKIISKPANSRVVFKGHNFDFTGLVSAEAKQTKFLMLDWSRLTGKSNGAISGSKGKVKLISVPIIGESPSKQIESLALYNLLQENPGYDVILNPLTLFKRETPFFRIGIYL